MTVPVINLHKPTEAMKARTIFTGLILGIASTAFAQVEYDDMYFNSKDRQKLKETRATETYALNSNKKKSMLDESTQNPTDSYSARNINPEYTSRANSEIAQEDEQDYFLQNYQYQNSNNYNNWNNNFNSWYDNQWYASSWYGPRFNTWNNPYYGYYGNSWAGSWYNDPFYYDPYSFYNGYGPRSYGYYGGSSWNYGWSMNFGWGRPYLGWGGAPWCYNSWYYPGNTIVVVNNGEASRNVTHGRRPSRNAYTTSSDQGRTRSAATPTTYQGGRSSTGGRTSGYASPTTSERQADYYNRSWRNSQQGNTTRSSGSSWSNSNSRSSSPSYSSPADNSRSSGSYFNNNTRSSGSSSSPTYSSPSRSSSSGYSGGSPSRSSSGSSSSGRSRGRD